MAVVGEGRGRVGSSTIDHDTEVALGFKEGERSRYVILYRQSYGLITEYVAMIPTHGGV